MVLRSTGQEFCRRSLSWDLSDVFLRIRLEQEILGGRPQRRSVIFVTHDMTSLAVSQCISVDVVLAEFPHRTCPVWDSMEPLSILCLWKRVCMLCPHLGGEELGPLP